MARVLRSQAAVLAELRVDLHRVPIQGCRELVTVGPEPWVPMLLGTAWEGCLVRVRPPAGVTAEQVEAVEKWVRAHGAAAVQVEGWAASAAVLRPVEPAAEGVQTIRQAVQAAAAAVVSQDQVALQDLLEQVLAEEGL